jgi:CubicO group peptidase (beta-lactamase class C family)
MNQPPTSSRWPRRDLLRLAGALPATALPGAGSARGRSSWSLDGSRIDRTLELMVAEQRAAGVSALIWQGGEQRYFRAAGFADLEGGRPMTRDTAVRIYSMTKPVTSVALMQLWEQGRFSLDDPLAQHLPEFARARVRTVARPGAEPADRPPARPIVVRDILRHTAGFSYGMGETAADAAYRAVDPLHTATDLRHLGRLIAGLPLQFDPGTQWGYSTAFDVQAVLVEALSGQPFTHCVQQRILAPLRMAQTGWEPHKDVARMAPTYLRDEQGRLVRQPNPAPQVPSGGSGLVSTLDDYMRFARMLLAGGSLDGERILQPATLRLMATDQLEPRITERHFLPGKGQLGFGLGFAVRTAGPATADEPRGAIGEFFWDGLCSTLFWVDPANDLAAVFLTQKLPFDGTLHRDFRAAVYGAGYGGGA